MGTSVFRIRNAVDFPPVLKSDHTMRSCRASMPGGLICFSTTKVEARIWYAHKPGMMFA
jgi:hypothetical protein